MKKLYITDLDGTLLDRDGRLSKNTVGILKALIEDGALVTVATGRSLVSLKEIMGECLPKLPVIIHNGARIGDPLTGEYLYNNAMHKGVLDEVLASAFANHFSPFLNAFQDQTDYFCYTLPANGHTEDYIRYRGTIMPEGTMRPFKFRTDLVAMDVINLNIIDDRARLEAFQEHIRESCSPWVDVHITTEPSLPDIGWLTVGDSRSHKAEAIRALAGLIMDEPVHITVFGDQLNDIHMFEVADRAVAVGNACPELMALAQEIIEPHWEDSVARYIARERIAVSDNGKEGSFEMAAPESLPDIEVVKELV